MKITLEGALPSEEQLPTGLSSGRHSTDIGRAWTVGLVWHVWIGSGWWKALATQAGPQ